MLPRAGPRVPSRSRLPPRSPARPGRPGAPPAARPCRRTGGRDRLLLRKFQVRKQGHTFPGEGQPRAELGSAGSARLGRSDSTRRPQPSRAGAPAAATRGGASETRTRALRCPMCPWTPLPSRVHFRSPSEFHRTRLTFCPWSLPWACC